MHSKALCSIVSATMILVVVSLACSALTPSTQPAAPAPTQAGAAVQPSQPQVANTATNEPAPTADTAGTQQAGARQAGLQVFMDKGYINTVDGKFTDVANFKQQWAQLGWYQWWPLDATYSTFVFAGHFKWSSASSTPEAAGCGVVFGLQESKDHYVVFLDRSRIDFELSRGGNNYVVGKTRGSGRTSFSNPAEADFGLLVNGQKAYVSVDGAITEYTLSADQTSSGTVALTLLSGTNRDYGTRCEMTNAYIWEPNQ